MPAKFAESRLESNGNVQQVAVADRMLHPAGVSE